MKKIIIIKSIAVMLTITSLSHATFWSPPSEASSEESGSEEHDQGHATKWSLPPESSSDEGDSEDGGSPSSSSNQGGASSSSQATPIDIDALISECNRTRPDRIFRDYQEKAVRDAFSKSNGDPQKLINLLEAEKQNGLIVGEQLGALINIINSPSSEECDLKVVRSPSTLATGLAQQKPSAIIRSFDLGRIPKLERLILQNFPPELVSHCLPNGHPSGLNPKHKPNYDKKKEILKLAFQETVLSRISGYKVNNTTYIPPQQLKCGITTNYSYSGLSQLHSAKPGHKTLISVINGDSLAQAMTLKTKGLNPVVVVLGNEAKDRRGGGVRNGHNAQEESITRRTLLSWAFKDNQESLVTADRVFDVLYNGQVPIIRDFKNDFILPINIGVIISCALNISSGKYKGAYASTSPNDETNFIVPTRKKIEMQLRTALLNGHDSIVLGALGGGVYAGRKIAEVNRVVSQLYAELLNSQEFKGRFKEVVFAILENTNENGLGLTGNTYKNSLGI